jgi:hypothetical protein
MIALLLAGGALAAGIHAGIPVAGVPGVSDPSFQTPDLGWTARVDGGWVRVFVGRDEAATRAWYGRALEGLQITPPTADGPGDEAHGDGDALLLFRDGNVAVMVRAEHGARAVADRLAAAVVDGVAWPVAPRLAQGADGRWRVAVPVGGTVTATGGRPVAFEEGAYLEPPATLVVWDALGRPAVVR